MRIIVIAGDWAFAECTDEVTWNIQQPITVDQLLFANLELFVLRSLSLGQFVDWLVANEQRCDVERILREVKDSLEVVDVSFDLGQWVLSIDGLEAALGVLPCFLLRVFVVIGKDANVDWCFLLHLLLGWDQPPTGSNNVCFY